MIKIFYSMIGKQLERPGGVPEQREGGTGQEAGGGEGASRGATSR